MINTGKFYWFCLLIIELMELTTVADQPLGHVERMSEDRVIKKLYMSRPEGRRSVGRPKMRWLDDVEEDLRKMRIGGWGGKARRRDEWKSVLRKVKILQGPSAIGHRYSSTVELPHSARVVYTVQRRRRSWACQCFHPSRFRSMVSSLTTDCYGQLENSNCS
jgi:hypothetical protein